MLSENCLQVKCLGIKKAALLLLNSTRKYFEVLALCGIRGFLWDHPPTPPPLFNLSNPMFLYLDCERFTRFQVAWLQFTMTSLFHLTTCFVAFYRKRWLSFWWALYASWHSWRIATTRVVQKQFEQLRWSRWRGVPSKSLVCLLLLSLKHRWGQKGEHLIFPCGAWFP